MKVALFIFYTTSLVSTIESNIDITSTAKTSKTSETNYNKNNTNESFAFNTTETINKIKEDFLGESTINNPTHQIATESPETVIEKFLMSPLYSSDYFSYKFEIENLIKK